MGRSMVRVGLRYSVTECRQDNALVHGMGALIGFPAFLRYLRHREYAAMRNRARYTGVEGALIDLSVSFRERGLVIGTIDQHIVHHAAAPGRERRSVIQGIPASGKQEKKQ
ncbi:hypothetical protein [Arhodomonas sp. SL1]|uniref:hypothetical protein n=1 Tax=Arhodomonas sp. SL1 TaxID=3425691 RepID=UPI003F881A23